MSQCRGSRTSWTSSAAAPFLRGSEARTLFCSTRDCRGSPSHLAAEERLNRERCRGSASTSSTSQAIFARAWATPDMVFAGSWVHPPGDVFLIFAEAWAHGFCSTMGPRSARPKVKEPAFSTTARWPSEDCQCPIGSFRGDPQASLHPRLSRISQSLRPPESRVLSSTGTTRRSAVPPHAAPSGCTFRIRFRSRRATSPTSELGSQPASAHGCRRHRVA